jgi:pimeloyl-ACP methyl ester carboxylesterase
MNIRSNKGRLTHPVALAFPLALIFLSIVAFVPPVASADPAPPLALEGFVEVNGVRLQYLDWGGSGPALILLHGLADNPHVFDDLAPAFTDRFHVIAYARRASGNSDVKGPYDVITLTNDLHGLMDALGIAKAVLVGHSAGGDEITELAAESPERVLGIIYLDAAYDWADSDSHAAFAALPSQLLERPAGAMASLEAFRRYQQETLYSRLNDMRRVEANLRDKVVIRTDGSLWDRTSPQLIEALYAALFANKAREYARVRCPALAIYAEHVLDVHDANPRRHAAFLEFENRYWQPFQRTSIERAQRELAGVRIVRVPDSRHASFFLTHRKLVVSEMRRFLNVAVGAAR